MALVTDAGSGWVQLNVPGLLYCAHAALPHSAARRRGRAAPGRPTWSTSARWRAGPPVAARVASASPTKHGAGAVQRVPAPGGGQAVRARTRSSGRARPRRSWPATTGPRRSEASGSRSGQTDAGRGQSPNAVTYIVTRPRHVAVNEMLIRPPTAAVTGTGRSHSARPPPRAQSRGPYRCTPNQVQWNAPRPALHTSRSGDLVVSWRSHSRSPCGMTGRDSVARLAAEAGSAGASQVCIFIYSCSRTCCSLLISVGSDAVFFKQAHSRQCVLRVDPRAVIAFRNRTLRSGRGTIAPIAAARILAPVPVACQNSTKHLTWASILGGSCSFASSICS